MGEWVDERMGKDVKIRLFGVVTHSPIHSSTHSLIAGQRSLLLPLINRRNSERQRGHFYLMEAGLTHQVAERLAVGKGLDGFVEIAVGEAVAGDQPADTREDLAEVEQIKRAHQCIAGQGEFQDDRLPAALEHPLHLAEGAGNVGNIADAEGDGHGIEPIRRERYLGGVTGLQGDGLIQTALLQLGAAELEHLLRHIDTDAAFYPLAVLEDRDQQIAGAGGQVKDMLLVPCREILRHPVPPAHILPEGQQAVEQVVTVGNPVKHFPYFRAGVGFGVGDVAGRMYGHVSISVNELMG